MKKLLALMLVFLMPLSALAETWIMSISVDAGNEALLEAMQAAFVEQGVPAAEAEMEAALAQKLVDGFGVDVVLQESAFSMILRLCGSQLIDLTAYEKEDQMLITSSLLPGYALSTPVEERENAEFDDIDWDGIGLSVVSALEEWLVGLEKSEAYGIFVGDAFDGGSKCTTWMLNDQCLAALVDAMLTDDVRAALNAFYTAAELDAEEIISELDVTNARVSQENRYTYVLRAVQNADDQLVGMSLTVLQDGEQVGTASLGFTADGVKLVIGLGFEQQNYWCEIIVNSMKRDGQTSCSAVMREWAGSKADAFAYVQGSVAPANTFHWEFDLTSSEKESTWTGAFAENGELLLTTTGAYVPEEMALKSVVDLGPDLLGIQFAFGPADEITALDETLTVCSITDPTDAELSEKLSNQLVATLMARLLKVLPVEQIMQINQFTLP